MDTKEQAASDQTYDLDHMMHSISELNRHTRELAAQPKPNPFGRTAESEQIASTILNSVMVGLPHIPHVDSHSEINSLFEPSLYDETDTENDQDEALITALAIKILTKQAKQAQNKPL